MGHFSNGTEGRDYQHNYCNRCIHDVKQDCQIWALHLTFNGDDPKGILDWLIPQAKDGLSNDQCRMFIDRTTILTDMPNPNQQELAL